jgi:endo-1,4-beta-xylanase
MVGWDVVTSGGRGRDGLRDCVQPALGPRHTSRAFRQARAADPDAVLFLNDYNLENIPRKGATFLRLVERLLAQGTPIDGIGTQSHLDIDIPAGQIRDFFRDAGSLGLPIHVSELDFPMRSDSPSTRSLGRSAPARSPASATGRGLMALPARQRFAFTTRACATPTAGCSGRAGLDDSPLLLNRRPPIRLSGCGRAFRGG